MVDLRTLHSMLIEMHGGMLTLAAVCILAMVAVAFHRRMRRKSERYGIFWPLDGFLERLARYAEPTAYLAGIGGVIGLVASSVIGYYVWPAEDLLSSPLGLNKVMCAVFATELWIVFLVIRSKYGEGLWKNGGLATVYVCVGFAGFFFIVLTGSLGGHMAGKGSVLDPIFDLIGVKPETSWIVGRNMLYVLAPAVAIVIISFFMLSRAGPKTRS